MVQHVLCQMADICEIFWQTVLQTKFQLLCYNYMKFPLLPIKVSLIANLCICGIMH